MLKHTNEHSAVSFWSDRISVCVRKGVKTQQMVDKFQSLFFLVFWVDLEELSLPGQTRCMLSGGGGSCHGRPGRYQDRISRLCLGDRTLSASQSLSVHRRPSLTVSWLPAQHDNSQHLNTPPGLLPYVQDFAYEKLTSKF